MDCSFTEMNLVEYKSHVKTISPPLILDCARSYPHIFLSGSLECDSIYLTKETEVRYSWITRWTVDVSVLVMWLAVNFCHCLMRYSLVYSFISIYTREKNDSNRDKLESPYSWSQSWFRRDRNRSRCGRPMKECKLGASACARWHLRVGSDSR